MCRRQPQQQWPRLNQKSHLEPLGPLLDCESFRTHLGNLYVLVQEEILSEQLQRPELKVDAPPCIVISNPLPRMPILDTGALPPSWQVCMQAR